MKRIFRCLGIAVGGIALLAVALVAYVQIASRVAASRTYSMPVSNFTAPTDAASIATGERLATIAGCNNCHGTNLAGAFMLDEPLIARAVAPNLTKAVRQYSDGELERVIRHGIKRDGTSTRVLPAQMFTHLTDADLGDIIAYIRSVPERDGVDGELTMRLLARVGMVTSKFPPVAAQIESARTTFAAATDDKFAKGRYLVGIACTECHGANLQGSDFAKAPSLIATAAYTDDFSKLMRTGVGVGNRRLGLMGEVGRARFSSLRDDEVAAVRAYLNEFVRQGGKVLP